jgi:hypothetical protein
MQMDLDTYMKLSKQFASQNLANEEKANESHLAHIPNVLHDNVIELTSVQLDCSAEPTVMLGIVNQAYSSSMWKVDVARWTAVFPNSSIIEIQLYSVRDSPQVLDTAKAIPKVEEGLSLMNSCSDNTPLRLILLGPGYAPGILFKTIRHLLKEWKTPEGGERQQKKLNFVISNTSRVEQYFDLCKRLCLTGVCHSIQFYNTDYYYPFGRYNVENDELA